MHDELLEALLQVANIRLVACYGDDRLGFAGADAIQVFLPDMHLCSNERAAQYQYRTNYVENGDDLLIRAVDALASFKLQAENAGRRAVVYHIGDYLDLWRQSPAPNCTEQVAVQIKSDHADLVNALESESLEALFLLGNHDFDLCQWHDYAAWDRRYFIPGGASPSVMVMHGDYFDWVEHLPEAVKDFAVYYFAPDKSPDAYALGQMKSLSYQTHAGKDYSACIQLPQPTVLGAALPSENTIPDKYNVQTPDTPGAAVQFLQSAQAECAKANRAYETNMRVVVIGHTHHARIAVDTGLDGGPFVLVDCGAWIENCRETAQSDIQPNAQIAALSNNEIRVYQLAPR